MQKTNLDKSNLGKIEALIKHLNLVKQITDAGYWITTDELCTLLSFDLADFEALNSREPDYRFEWRNFIFTQVACQGTTKMWEISGKYNSQLITPLATSIQPLIPPQLTPQLNAELIAPSPVLTEGDIISSEYAWVENFLTAAQSQRLMEYVQAQEQNFKPTANSANDPNYRRSMVLYSFPEFAELMNQRIHSITPYILTYLRIDSFVPSNVEIQLTLHNDGNYYKIHNDSGSPDCANRVLTFVYYFYREPKAFLGGELVLYDSKVENNRYVAASTFKKITPQNNSIVFFPSYYMHEVLPVSCPSQAFLDSRFTINGWVRN